MGSVGEAVCLLHGRPMSDHQCLYCCLCFRELTIDECNRLPDGTLEDVCVGCAKTEQGRHAAQ